jgi:hypothetical protein
VHSVSPLLIEAAGSNMRRLIEVRMHPSNPETLLETPRGQNAATPDIDGES